LPHNEQANLILIGAGGHAHACIDVIEQQDQYRIAGLVGMPEELHSTYLGYSVIGTDSDLPQLAKEWQFALITLGQIRSPDNRIRLYRLASKMGFQLPIIISPNAHVSSHSRIGGGTIVMNGAIVNAGVKVGVNCIINSRSLLEHDATIEDHCHLSTGSIINGNVKIGEGSFVGSGSVIKEGVSIGRGCLVGMGLSVRHCQSDHSRFVGNDKR